MAEDPPPPADKMTDDDADALRDLVIDLRRTLPDPTARDIAEGRQALIDIGPKIFGETGAGSEILDMRR